MAADTTGARRMTNKTNALALAKAGLYIFVSSGKTPLIPRFNKIDTELTADERAAAIEEFETKHGKPPVHVGATRDLAALKKMFRSHPDAVPSVACGPSKLVVIDADQKDNGPELIGKHFEEHGLPEGAVMVPSQSGGQHYIFSDPDGRFTNSAGALKRQYGCDVRGKNGQYVAPGSIREDGKTYGSQTHLIEFLRAYTKGALPTLPDHIVELIGRGGEASQSVNESKLKPIVQELQDTDWPTHEELFDVDVGMYDIEALKAADPTFSEIYTNPPSDRSDARWSIAQRLLRKWRMPVVHLAVFYEGWEGAGHQTEDGEGAGNYNLRDIAREWFKNCERYASDGEALADVPSEIENDEADLDDETLRRREIERKQRQERAERARRETDAAQQTADSTEPQKTEKANKNTPVIHRSVALHAAYTPADDLIEGLLPATGLVALVADANVGKTFLAIEMLDCVMRGSKFLGRNTDSGDVLLVAGEGQEGLRKRMAALHTVRPYEDGEGIGLSFKLPIFEGAPEAGAKILRRQIEEAQNQSGRPVRLVALDNLIGMLGAGDLKDSKDVKPMLDALARLANEMKLCILIIHHENRSGSSAGTFAIRASVDVQLLIAEEKGVRTIKIDKSRDDSKGLKLQYKLQYVPLGYNKWGTEVGSCVVVQHGAPSEGKALTGVQEHDVEDTEAPGVSDKLTAEQNSKAEENRLKLLSKVREAMSAPGVAKVVGDEVRVPLAEIERRVKAVGDLKKTTQANNYARELKELLFRGEMAERLDDGWLSYRGGIGKRPSLLIFSTTIGV